MVETPKKITLWGIEVFVATAQEQSISAAARRLGASPSAISQQLSNLEIALGAVLLNRRERPVTMTPAGEAFRARAQNILNEAAQARAELARVDHKVLPQLRLGMIEDFDSGVTPLLLAELAKDMATTQFLLETGASHRLFDQLETRALDMIVATDMGVAAGWMEVFPLMVEPFVSVAPKGLISPKNPGSQLLELPFIRYTSRHHMGRVIADHLVRQNLNLATRFELDSYHAIMAMVADGAGWTILTPLGVTHAKRFSDAVDILPLPCAPLSRSISGFARRDILGDMPGIIATKLRQLLQDRIVSPQVARLPWLKDELSVV
ncbi:MAG: LysR family transcriptional regulator [Paracoccaceae bacterium]